MGQDKPFVPYLATLKSVIDLTPDVKLLKVELADPGIRASFDYKPGQFAMLSAFGEGEAPFGIVSLANEDGLEFAVRRIGSVTRALHETEPGESLGIRGPFGNCFPLENYVNKNIVIIGGGIGMAPLRPVIKKILGQRNKYGKLLIINGARSPKDLVFAPEFQTWMEAPNTKLVLTVDRGDEKWGGKVGLIPDVVKEVAPSPDNTIAIVCGPPIMIYYTLQALKNLNFKENQIVTTLEAKMKCGMGKCARCNVGEKYVCKDGPVFTLEQISQFLEQP